MTQLWKVVTNTTNAEAPWNNDKLDRQAFAVALDPIVDSVTQPFVIGLYSEYGTGKTHFLECWQQHLINRKYSVVKFDAWSTDFAQSPLVAFMAAITNHFVDGKSKDSKSKAQAAIALTKKLGGFMVKRMIPEMAKVAGKKIAGEDFVEGILKVADGEAVDVGGALGEASAQALLDQMNAQNSVEEFRKSLGELVAKFGSNPGSGPQLIILVDELDRCRPLYAVEVLECIKHLFSVAGVLFVLAIDKKSITSAVGALYGAQLDAEGYLRRFMDLQITLPVPSLIRFADYLFETFELEKLDILKGNLAQNRADIVRVCGVLSTLYKLSLRKMGQLFTQLNLVLRATHKTENSLAFDVAMATMLRDVEPGKLRWTIALGELDKFEHLIRETIMEIQSNGVELQPDDFVARMRASFITDAEESKLIDEINDFDNRLGQLSRSNGDRSSYDSLRAQKIKRGRILKIRESYRSVLINNQYKNLLSLAVSRCEKVALLVAN